MFVAGANYAERNLSPSLVRCTQAVHWSCMQGLTVGHPVLLLGQGTMFVAASGAPPMAHSTECCPDDMPDMMHGMHQPGGS
jgi:hypothetical protein